MFERYIDYMNVTENVLKHLGHIRYLASRRDLPKEQKKIVQKELDTVEAALNTLPEHDREILDIFYLSNPESVEEAMRNGKEQFDLSQTALRKHKKAALKRLQSILFPGTDHIMM